VCTSDISFTTVGADGNPVLLYRGYRIYDLVKGLFEESVYLLLEGELPNPTQLTAFSQQLKKYGRLEDPVCSSICARILKTSR